MDDLIKDMQNEVDARMAGGEHAFSARALFNLLQLLGCKPSPAQRHDPEFGFAWFHSAYPNFPVYLEARRTVLDLSGVISNMIKTDPWDELMALMEETGREHCGIILRAKLGKPLGALWIIHAAWNLDHAPGKIRMLYKARTKERGVIVERLDSFVESVKLSGWTF